MLTPDIQQAAAHSVLCWLATVGPDGQPNVSPKEIWAVADEAHIVIAHIASPTSVRNVQAHPQVCVSFVDVSVQKGFKVLGEARLITPADTDYDRWSAPLITLAGPKIPIRAVLLVRATCVEPIVAPRYRLYPDSVTEASQVQAAMRRYGVRPGGDQPPDSGTAGVF
jgi:predicted pyridoxine 5'-phosphate oxidase superfamily flavin-nucleotide-binding protein